MSNVEFFKHNIDGECIAEFNAVAKDLFITTGPKTAEFEKKFAEYLGLPYAVGLMSCTHALHLAYVALEIGQNDEVIVPAFTFAATATSVMHAGAKPVFSDVDANTGILDPSAVEAAITPRTKAICPVHLYGVMAPMERFHEIAKKYNLKLIEDAAHCIEGRHSEFGLGTLSDAVAFSFYATKNITCGEGGALATRHKELAEKVVRLRTHGMTKNAINRYTGEYTHYQIEELGYKYNMMDILAALLLPQLRRIGEFHARRAAIVGLYNEGLKNVDGIILPSIPGNSVSAYHLYTIRVVKHEKRDHFLTEMKKEGINCAVHYVPLGRLSFFRDKLGMKVNDFPNARDLGDSTISLPLYSSLTDLEAERVIEAVKKVSRKLLV